MTRYNDYSGSGTGSNNDRDFDDKTLKLQNYSTVRLTPDRINVTDTNWGDRLIAGFEDGAILDGIVFQRDDRPDTWKVFSPQKFFNVGPDGLVYESYDADADEYSGEMSADDVLQHPRVQGFSETFGGDSYWYTPVGVVIEEADDMAVNDDLDVETDDGAIVMGETSMLLSNKSWVRTFGKLVTEEGDDVIATEVNESGDEVPVSDDRGWLTTDEPTLRSDIEGRALELFLIEETAEFDDGEVTYTTPILLDAKTGERVTIDNEVTDDAEADEQDAEPAKATDGGTTAEAQNTNSGTEQPETTESPDEPAADDGDDADDDAAAGHLPDDVPAVLDELIDYFARTEDGEVAPEELRDFAEGEVDDPDAVDWSAAVEEAKRRA